MFWLLLRQNIFYDNLNLQLFFFLFFPTKSKSYFDIYHRVHEEFAFASRSLIVSQQSLWCESLQPDMFSVICLMSTIPRVGSIDLSCLRKFRRVQRDNCLFLGRRSQNKHLSTNPHKQLCTELVRDEGLYTVLKEHGSNLTAERTCSHQLWLSTTKQKDWWCSKRHWTCTLLQSRYLLSS